jgi:anti-anti-sigma factor
MESNVITNGDGKHIALSGQLTFADNQKFRKIVELASDSSVRSLEFDVSAMDFIDSAGLGMFLLLRDECLKRNISISIHSAQGQVEKIFTISKFDQLFSMPDKKQAS